MTARRGEALVPDPAALSGVPARRGTTNRNVRGSSYDRAARRAFLLAKFGDGKIAPCYRFEICRTVLDDATITVDRIKPGIEGGTYRRDNIRPACQPCNTKTGNELRWSPARTAVPA